MKSTMTLLQLLKHWKNIKAATIRKNGKTYNILATKRTLHCLYKDGVVDEWQEYNKQEDF